ncbi:unnamed protein product [marine sediment metagenome]|uniref:Uncharacterized protein n=2 Tax=marine sediment metagenome TaxID=412755 RepID=X1RUA8_9ZZZZ
MLNALKEMKVTRVLSAVAAGQTVQPTSIIDMKEFDGIVFLALFGSITTGALTSMKAQQGKEDDMSDAADLEGSEIDIADDKGDQALILDIFRPQERYLKAIISRDTQDAIIDGVIAIQYGADYMPTVHDVATIAGTKFLLSPAEGTA